jgi:O-methyltransferase involved in polyketide biosynthesis
MDTRPWRLALPPGTSWFEVDQPDLLAAKVAALDALGVQQEVAGQPGRAGVVAQLWGLVRQARWLAALRWAGLVAWWTKDAVLQQVVDYLNKRVSGVLLVYVGF